MDYLLESIGLKKPHAGAKGVLAEFDGPGPLLAAARKLHERGFTRYDSHSPFPIHGMDDAMALPPSRLGWVVFLAACLGGGGGLLLEWFVSAVDYPVIISGKPFFSLPAFIPVAFELTILGAAFGAVFGMFAFNQLPRFHHPVFYSDRFGKITDDGFFISIESSDPLFSVTNTPEYLNSIGGKNIELLHPDDEKE